MSEPENELKINLGGYDPTVITRAINRMTETIARHFEDRTHSLLFEAPHKNALDKCKGCEWFHEAARFCAVAPQNLKAAECGERQVPEQFTNLDYLEARSPERIKLVRSLARKLNTSEIELEQKFHRAWTKNPEPFDAETLKNLLEIQKIGNYSIAQMEIIGDGIRGSSAPFVFSFVRALEVKDMVLTGYEFHSIVYSMVLTPPGYF